MGKKLAAATATCLALLVLATAPSAGAWAATEKDTLEANLVSRLNVVRRNHGLRPLKAISPLERAADRHADSMAVTSYFRHELYTPARSTDWTPFGTWIRWYWPGPGYGSWSAGENLAWGAPDVTAYDTVSRWMASPGHRANVLNPAWRSVGVAAVHVRDPRGYYGSWDDVTIVAAEFGVRG